MIYVDKMLTVPVLLIIFNRPHTTKLIFDAVKKVRPKSLYICADGPRPTVASDLHKCNDARAIIDYIDWDCELKTLFQDNNLGCKKAVSAGIDWFFKNVEEGIILEDDCLPEVSFFAFCEELLRKYRFDERVMQICGSNFIKDYRRSEYSYYYSLFGPIWGWASWRRAWIHYDVNMKLWPEIKKDGVLNDICLNKDEVQFRYELYEKLYKGEIDTWDYQWGFAKMINSGLSITPNVNLISNIGFGDDATHTSLPSSSHFANMQTKPIVFPLIHPKFMVRDKVSDLKYLTGFALQGKPSHYSNIFSRLAKKMVNKVKDEL